MDALYTQGEFNGLCYKLCPASFYPYHAGEWRFRFARGDGMEITTRADPFHDLNQLAVVVEMMMEATGEKPHIEVPLLPAFRDFVWEMAHE